MFNQNLTGYMFIKVNVIVSVFVETCSVSVTKIVGLIFKIMGPKYPVSYFCFILQDGNRHTTVKLILLFTSVYLLTHYSYK